MLLYEENYFIIVFLVQKFDKFFGGIYMLKIFRALSENAKKQDTKPTEKLLNNQVRLTIEQLGEKYLKDADDILQFEATSKSALDATLEVLDSEKFKENMNLVKIVKHYFL